MSAEPLDLDPIVARLEAATPGPWRWRGNVDYDCPRLVGSRREGEGFAYDVLAMFGKERQPGDRGAQSYARGVAEHVQVRGDDGGWRDMTSVEVSQRVIDEYLNDDFGNRRRDTMLAFVVDGYYKSARELPIFEVAPDVTDRDDPKVYRADITGVRHPDAELIAHAPTATSSAVTAARLTMRVMMTTDPTDTQAFLGRELQRAGQVIARLTNEIVELKRTHEPATARTVNGRCSMSDLSSPSPGGRPSFVTVVVQPANDGNPLGAALFQAPRCPHVYCGRTMAVHQPPFLTDEPPSWSCQDHGNEGVTFVFTEPPKPKGCIGTGPYLAVLVVLS